MVSSPSFMHCVFTAQSFVWGLLSECSGRLSTGAVVPSGADDWVSYHILRASVTLHGRTGSPEPMVSPPPSLSSQATCSTCL